VAAVAGVEENEAGEAPHPHHVAERSNEYIGLRGQVHRVVHRPMGIHDTGSRAMHQIDGSTDSGR